MSSSSAIAKFYAVQNGRRPGVYVNWPDAQAQIIGWTRPRHKAFSTRAEAEAFVAVSADLASTGEADGSASTNGDSVDLTSPASKSGTSAKPPVKKAKATKKAVIEQLPSEPTEPSEYEPGEGPLPEGAEDGFDPRIILNPSTGKIEYRSAEQRSATKWAVSGSNGEDMVRIYTDGSSLGNGQNGAVAGVGVFFGPGDRRNVSAPLVGSRQTNQRAELTAIMKALELAPRDRPVTIYSDSSYSIKCVTEWFYKWRSNNWLTASKRPVENKDLVEKIIGLLEERHRIHGDGEDGAAVESSETALNEEYGTANSEVEADDKSKKLGVTAGGRSRGRVHFVWVKGHKDDVGNIAADALAVAGARGAKGTG
ncbi:hypothetical protein LTR50_002329 [Elasticomyces elasticus]|nr:hypothetical protein LTR50_002329 [Elasticomyces elasticus]